MIRKTLIQYKVTYQVISKHVFKITNVLTTPDTLAQTLPISHNKYHLKETVLGFSKEAEAPYWINFKANDECKNVMIVGKGSYRNLSAINWLMNAYACGFKLCMIGCMGRELSKFIKGCGGVSLTLTSNCNQYVNTFVIKKNGSSNPVVHFNKCFERSIKMLKILANLKADREVRGEMLLEEFLQSVYLSLGVLPDNPNTWYRTECLNPHKIYKLFVNYLSKAVRMHYSSVVEDMLFSFKKYLDKRKMGCNNFQYEYSLEKLMQYDVIGFDLSNWSLLEEQDRKLLKLNVFHLHILQEEFIESKRANKQWTINLVKDYPKNMNYGNTEFIVNMTLTDDIRKLTSRTIENMDLVAFSYASIAEADYLQDELNVDDIQLGDNQFLIINNMDMNNTILETFMPRDNTS